MSKSDRHRARAPSSDSSRAGEVRKDWMTLLTLLAGEVARRLELLAKATKAGGSSEGPSTGPD